MSEWIISPKPATSLRYVFDLERHVGKRKSLNKGNQVLNANDRLYFMTRAAISNFLRQLSKDEVLKSQPSFSVSHPKFDPAHPCSILISVYTATHRRIDPPNLYPTVKALIDGMTDAGVWSDDSSRVIKLLSFEDLGVSPLKKFRIVLTITPWKEAKIK